MEEKKILGIDYNTLLVLGWIAPLVLNFAGVILAIIFTQYFKNEKKEDFLAEGFRQISNVYLSLYIVFIGFVISGSLFFLIPGIGLIFGIVILIASVVVSIYALFVSIVGAVEASKHNIYIPKYQIEFLKK